MMKFLEVFFWHHELGNYDISEKATEEKMVNSQPRPRNKTSSFNIVEDTMYLARVKESCTTLGIQHNNGRLSMAY